MKLSNPFNLLSKLEILLWLFSSTVVALCFMIVPEKSFLNLGACLVGVTALIFLAKGAVIGQALVVVFSVFYGIISLKFRYYGEMITYLGMSAPAAVVALVSWLKHPYKQTAQVKVERLNTRRVLLGAILTLVVTVAFYFILKFFNTANLIFSTISVTTSFFASYLTYLRSPYYALAYALNDIVLIVLWVLASVELISYLPMVACFGVFLINDLYGYFSWQKMRKCQEGNNDLTNLQ